MKAVICVLLSLVIAAAPRAENRPTGFFAPLEKGMKVNLKESGNGYEINVVPGLDLGFTIIGVGQDFVVLEDLAGVTQIRVPIYSVRAIKITRVTKK